MIVDIQEAKTLLSELIERVLNGEQIIIAKAGRPVAVLAPLEKSANPRIPGNDAGKVFINSDFDEPLPEL